MRFLPKFILNVWTPYFRWHGLKRWEPHDQTKRETQTLKWHRQPVVSWAGEAARHPSSCRRSWNFTIPPPPPILSGDRESRHQIIGSGWTGDCCVVMKSVAAQTTEMRVALCAQETPTQTNHRFLCVWLRARQSVWEDKSDCSCDCVSIVDFKLQHNIIEGWHSSGRMPVSWFKTS